MTEQELKDNLINLGYDEENISENIELYYMLKAKYNLTLNEWYVFITKAHEKIKNMPEDYVSVD